MGSVFRPSSISEPSFRKTGSFLGWQMGAFDSASGSLSLTASHPSWALVD